MHGEGQLPRQKKEQKSKHFISAQKSLLKENRNRLAKNFLASLFAII
jgi:hypothetical protein